jgi:hypothetical protein
VLFFCSEHERCCTHLLDNDGDAHTLVDLINFGCFFEDAGVTGVEGAKEVSRR